jgi:UDP-4-amino-4,6-dideoxy-N-acetyl-beta-L-altrosamine transaminase
MNWNRKKYNYGKQQVGFDDIIEVIKVLKSPFLTQGPKVREFEDAICNYTGAKYCVAVANGTAALHLCMLALDVQSGDEVITSPNTFLASSNCVLYAGGTPKFADIDQKTACIDVNEIEKQITPKTKGIIPVHFAGIPCNMEKIRAVADKHNLFVVEDAAHAIGSEYKDSKIGSCKYSDMTIFSFHPVKTITTGEGGAITTNDKELYEKLLSLRSHCMVRGEGWKYEMRSLGFNYRLTDIQAALGISQLRKLDRFKVKRRELFNLYKQEFTGNDGFMLLEEPEYSHACYHLCPLLIDFEKVKIGKEELFERLKQAGLNLQVHYIPVHTQPYYKQLGFKEGDFPKAEEYYKKTLSLPLYPILNYSDIKHIVKIIKETAK